MFSPKLAFILGTDEAIVLEFFHKLLEEKKDTILIEGKHWVRKPQNEISKIFYHISNPTIRKVISRLEKLKLIKSSYSYGVDCKYKRIKMYSIDYVVFEDFVKKSCKNHENLLYKSPDPIDQKLYKKPDPIDQKVGKNTVNFDQKMNSLPENFFEKTVFQFIPSKEACVRGVYDNIYIYNNINIYSYGYKYNIKLNNNINSLGYNNNFSFINNISVKQIYVIFDFWRQKTGRSKSKLDNKRKRLIQNALKLGYTAEELCKAIDGCCKTPFNMGQNDRGQRYDGLDLIFRNADKIDYFIRNSDNPPKSKSAADKITDANLNAAKNWINKKKGVYCERV